jgi:hypothetical protein
MVKSGQTKKGDSTHWQGRLRKARQFLEIAQTAVERAAPSVDGGPIMSNCILSAVAYADTLTAAVSGIINQGDHAGITKLLRGVLGNDLPKAQETHLKQMLARKDDVQYGAGFDSLLSADQMTQRAQLFADWAENELARRFPEEMSRMSARNPDDGDGA